MRTPGLEQRVLAGVVDERAVVAQPQAGGGTVLLDPAAASSSTAEMADRKSADRMYSA